MTDKEKSLQDEELDKVSGGATDAAFRRTPANPIEREIPDKPRTATGEPPR